MISSSALLELPALLAIGLVGVGFWVFAGVRKPLLVAGLSPLGSSALALLGFPAVQVFNVSPLMVLMVIGFPLFAFVFARSALRKVVLEASAYIAGLAALGWSLRWLIVLPERVGEDAISVMLQSVLELQAGEAPSDPRRGFAYPLMISMSETGTILSSYTPVLLLSLLVVIGCFGFEFLPSPLRREGAIALTVSLGVLCSTPIIWLAVTYTNSHVLMSLAIAAISGTAFRALKRLSLSQTDQILIFVSSLVGGTTRFEGGVLVLVAILPVLIDANIFRLSRKSVVFLSSGPIVGYSYWHLFIPTGELTTIDAAVGAFLLIPPVLLLSISPAAISRFGPFLKGSVSVGLFGVFLSTMFLKYPSSWTGFALVNSQNLLLGVGGWGATLTAGLIVGGVMVSYRHNRLVRLALLLSLWGVLATIDLKLIDSPPGNRGFNNTIVRTLIHWVGPFMYLWILAADTILREFLSRRSDAQRAG